MRFEPVDYGEGHEYFVPFPTVATDMQQTTEQRVIWALWQELQRAKAELSPAAPSALLGDAAAKEKAARLEGYLERINEVMWNSYGVKERIFGRDDGTKIMEILNEWASRNE